MPVFEYKCTDCNDVYDVLHKGAENPDIVQCPSCASRAYIKQFSSFAATTGGSVSSAPACDTGACDIPSYGSCANGMCGLG